MKHKSSKPKKLAPQKKQKTFLARFMTKMRILTGRTMMLTGVILIVMAGYLFYQRINPNRLKFDNYTPPNEVSTDIPAGAPKRIIIKELGINLEIVPANIIQDHWQTTFDGVSYLASSPIPGTAGNSIMYGHNWKSLLGNLKNAKPGQTIRVIDNSGHVTNFEINYVQTVDPDDKSILDQTDDSRLTLYTCTGFLDSKRLVVTAIKT